MNKPGNNPLDKNAHDGETLELHSSLSLPREIKEPSPEHSVPCSLVITPPSCRRKLNSLACWTLQEVSLRSTLERQHQGSVITSSSNDSLPSSIIYGISDSSDLAKPLKSSSSSSSSTTSSSGSAALQLVTSSKCSKLVRRIANCESPMLESNLQNMHLNAFMHNKSQTPNKHEGISQQTCSSPRCRTPYRVPHNPFEEDLLSTIHLPSFSPTMFSQIASPSQNEDTPFHWPVENLAILYPADIDVTQHENACEKEDQIAEEQVQSAIDKFFAQGVVPSPWLTNCAATKHVTFSPKLASTGYVNTRSDSATSSGSSILKDKRDAICQTTLTLPINFDLKKILSKYYTFHQESVCIASENEDRSSDENDSDTDIMSTSSLRRKLFATCADSNAQLLKCSQSYNNDLGWKIQLESPLSPVKAMHQNKPPESPSNFYSAQFSSSPIARNVMRSSIISSTHMTSPLCSPITYSHREALTRDGLIWVPSEEMTSPQLPLAHTDDDCKTISPVPCLKKSSFNLTHETETIHEVISNDISMRLNSSMELPRSGNPALHLNSNPVYLEPMSVDHTDYKCSYMDVSEMLPVASITHQDTGYHTGSLQSTNQELTGSTSSTEKGLRIPYSKTNATCTLQRDQKLLPTNEQHQEAKFCDNISAINGMSWIHFHASTPSRQELGGDKSMPFALHVGISQGDQSTL